MAALEIVQYGRQEVGTEMIDIREKKYTVYNLYEMFLDGQLVFPFKPIALYSFQKKAQEAIDILLLSIPFPTVYVSERQDGSFVVLDSSSRLLGLLELLNEKFKYKTAGANNDFDGRKFSEIDRYAPSVTSAIMETKIRVEIIEYYTPLFLHMRTGLAVESWTIQQEQAVRNVLYEGKGINRLKHLASDMHMPGESGRSKEFCVLNILLVEFLDHVNQKEGVYSEFKDEQYWFEVTISFLNGLKRKQIDQIKNELEQFGDFCSTGLRGSYFGIGFGRRQASQYRSIAYLFHMWLQCRNSRISTECLERMILDKKMWNAIGKAAYSPEAIRNNMSMLGGLMRC